MEVLYLDQKRKTRYVSSFHTDYLSFMYNVYLEFEQLILLFLQENINIFGNMILKKSGDSLKFL